MDPKVSRFIRELARRELTVAFAESVTGGLAAHKLCTAVGTSKVFNGGIVCYTPEVKSGLLKVSKRLIEKHTAESQQVTDALVTGLRKLIDADIHAALTGLASPGGSEAPGKPVGTVFIAVRYRNHLHRLRKVFRGTPLEIRSKACLAMYDFILKIV